MMAHVIERHGHSIDKRGYIHYDDRPSTYEAAEKLAGRRLDRRRNYAIIDGQVCDAARIARLTEDAVLERNGLKPIPTAVTVAPRGYSWHGDRLQKDELGTLTRNPQAKGD